MSSMTEQAVLFGVMAGMRASAPLVAAASAERPREWYALLGELCGDKLPFTPSRLQPGGWLGRIATAAFGAYRSAAAQANGVSPVRQAVIAGAVALVATKAAHDLRATVVEKLNAPDIVIALLEDALLLTCVVRVRSSRGVS